MQDPLTGIFFLIVILISAIIHEYMHGWMANYLGDPTAKYAGRLTLNPVPHIDPIGTILVPMTLLLFNVGFLFGWAKPVPFNPYNLRDQQWGPGLVGAAGPLTNFAIAIIFSIVIRLFEDTLSLGVLTFFAIIVQANLILGIFNMLPIPPLDGSKVLFAFLPPRYMQVQYFLEKNGFLILIAFILFGNRILVSLLDFFYSLFLGF